MAKALKGALEVVATRRTRRGESENYVEEGTTGYVVAALRGSRLIHWNMKPQYKGDWCRSVHPTDDVKPTGNRHR